MSNQFRAPRWTGDARPDFAEGNTMSTRSGAWSPRFIDETMEELRPQLQAIIDEGEWLLPIDEHALLDYLHDMARGLRLERWLAEVGDRYPEGHKHEGELRDRDLRELGALRNRLLTHRARLGLDPVSRRQLASVPGSPAVAEERKVLLANARRMLDARTSDRGDEGTPVDDEKADAS